MLIKFINKINTNVNNTIKIKMLIYINVDNYTIKMLIIIIVNKINKKC